MAKMWAGRTEGNVDKLADDFNSSIHFDCRMYRQDITGSMAHAAMLAAKGILSQQDADALIAGLEEILGDLDSGKLQFDMNCEDIHMFVEQVLTERMWAKNCTPPGAETTRWRWISGCICVSRSMRSPR